MKAKLSNIQMISSQRWIALVQLNIQIWTWISILTQDKAVKRRLGTITCRKQDGLL